MLVRRVVVFGSVSRSFLDKCMVVSSGNDVMCVCRHIDLQAALGGRDDRIRSLEQSLQDAMARAAELEAGRAAADEALSAAAAQHQEEVFKLQVCPA